MGRRLGCETAALYRVEVVAALAYGPRERRERRRPGLELRLVSSSGTMKIGDDGRDPLVSNRGGGAGLGFCWASWSAGLLDRKDDA
jgi:hypothetical protein